MLKEWENRSLESNFRPKSDFVAISILLCIFWILRNIIVNRLSRIILNKSVLNESEKKKIYQKLHGSLYRFIIYIFLFFYGVCTLYNEEWIYTPFEYTLTWENNLIPTKIKIYYILELSHYIVSFFFLLDEPKMSDFYQMVLHHIITLFLISLSYYTNLLRFGVVVMILHDVSDPLMDGAKIFFYTKYQKIADILFCSFAGVFTISRMFIYTGIIVIPCLYYSFVYGHSVIFSVLTGLLVFLLFINLIWCFFIFKMVFSFMKYGTVKGDIRTDDAKNK